MAKHIRKRLRVVAEELEPAEPAFEMPATGVGGTLRAERMRRGLQVADVAQSLRIRRSLLEAIEDNRFAALPGLTYAIGFLRAYADHLGLDADEIVRRFRAEAQGINTRVELNFPAPPAQGRVPGVVIVLLSLLLAGGGYGFWYYASLDQRPSVERVAPLPQRLAPLADERALPPSPSQAEAATVASPRLRSGSDPIASTTAVRAPEAPASAPSVPAETQVAGRPATAPTPQAPAQFFVPPHVADENAPAPGASASEGGAPLKVYGETGGPVRIAIRATSDSWIQILDNQGEVVFMRILRPGDVYNVPNRTGLRLSTGNAGALDIRVDGRSVPPIGRPGFVRRDVALNPERLLAGAGPAASDPGASQPAAPRPSDG